MPKDDSANKSKRPNEPRLQADILSKMAEFILYFIFSQLNKRNISPGSFMLVPIDSKCLATTKANAVLLQQAIIVN